MKQLEIPTFANKSKGISAEELSFYSEYDFLNVPSFANNENAKRKDKQGKRNATVKRLAKKAIMAVLIFVGMFVLFSIESFVNLSISWLF